MTERRLARRQEALDRFEAALELPLLLLAVAMLPLIVIPLVTDLSATTEAAFTAASWFIWAVFAFEYVVRLALTTRRWRFIRWEWADLLIIVVPFLRPLRLVHSARALHLLRLGRLVAVLGELESGSRRLLRRHSLHYALAVTFVIVLGAAALTLAAEEGSGGTIDSYGDALWWAVAMVASVYYGESYPITPAGRGVAVFLMLCRIALFGILTANVAAFFLEPEVDDAVDPVADRLDEVLHRLDAIDNRLGRSVD